MSRPLQKLQRFFRELKRRNVYKVAVAYIAVAFVVLQGARLLVPALVLPEWFYRVVVGLALLGFPLALVLAWAFELSPEGLVRTGPPAALSSDHVDVADPKPGEGAGPETADRRRLAVLPLAKIHSREDEEYFADGMTEELIGVISRIQSLEVIARTSVIQYRDTTKPVAEIANDLGVGAVLEGSVRKVGDRLRISVQLIDAGSQAHLWSRTYDRQMREVFQVQSNIARNVADALEVTLLGDEEDRVGRSPTDDLEAYDCFLLGRHQLAKRSSAGVRRALDHFRDASERDPRFALAHAGMADAYLLAGIGYAAIPGALERAERAARRALELDPDLPEAHSSLGYAALNRGWDWRTAERELRRALALNPSDARAHQWYAQLALYRQQYEEAARRYQRARELDPLSVVIQNESGWPPLYQGDFDEAMRRFREAASMDPSFAIAHFNMGECHEAEGRFDEAIASYRKAVELSERTPVFVSFLGASLAEAGREEEARALREEIAARVSEGADLFLCLAVIEEALGETSRALEHLERALERREPLVAALDTTWLPMTSLHDEPRFRAILEEVHERLGVES